MEVRPIHPAVGDMVIGLPVEGLRGGIGHIGRVVRRVTEVPCSCERILRADIDPCPRIGDLGIAVFQAAG